MTQRLHTPSTHTAGMFSLHSLGSAPLLTPATTVHLWDQTAHTLFSLWELSSSIPPSLCRNCACVCVYVLSLCVFSRSTDLLHPGCRCGWWLRIRSRPDRCSSLCPTAPRSPWSGSNAGHASGLYNYTEINTHSINTDESHSVMSGRGPLKRAETFKYASNETFACWTFTFPRILLSLDFALMTQFWERDGKQVTASMSTCHFSEKEHALSA